MKHTSSIVPAALLALTISSVATPAGAQGSAPLNETDRRAVVESAAKMLRERYVFPDIGTKAASAIESALAGGSYAGLDQLAEFAQRLTEDLAAVARDKHLRITAPGARTAAPPRATPPRAEGGITRADILDDNVGYIEVVGFPPPAAFNEPLNRAMAALQKKPVVVLTSARTFSGGEEFAYDMQVIKLGNVVGETTAGGANPGGTVRLAAGLAMFIPGGRARNPITGTNWDGVGVRPDIAVPSENALKAALDQLRVSSAGGEIDALSRSRVFEPGGPRP